MDNELEQDVADLAKAMSETRDSYLIDDVQEELYTDVETLSVGVKHDKGKSRIDLVPPDAIIGMGDVAGYGADKYAARNWERGLDWGRLYAAAMRHMLAFQSGESVDAESGLQHLDHALFSLAMLRSSVERGLGKDDRGDR